MILRTTAALVAGAGLLMISGGCAAKTRSVSIAAWQRNLEDYVQKKGGGDPAVLRDLELWDDRPGYAMLGADRPPRSTDANGVLLGFRRLGGRNWFIYLVGLVQNQHVKEIRLAALSVDDGNFTWLLGEKDDEALRRYCDYNEELWQARASGSSTPPPSYSGFPRPEDQFELAVEEAQVSVKHEASAAAWELKVGAPVVRR